MVPDSMFVLPVRDGTPLPNAFRRTPSPPPSRSSYRRPRSAQPRPLDRRVDTTRPALTRGWQVATRLVPVAFLTLFFAYPLAAILERGLSAGAAPPSPRGRPGCCGSRSGRRRRRPLSRSPPACRSRGRSDASGSAAARSPALWSSCPFVLPTVVVAAAFLALLPEGHERGHLGDPCRARVFQHRRRDAHRRWCLGGDRAAKRPRQPPFSAPGRCAGREK